MKTSRWQIATILILILSTAQIAAAAGWPHLRGPAMDGRVSAEIGENPGLELAWRVPLGSGYSGIAVADGVAVTAFSDEESDLVAAFDLATGREIWRHTHDSVNKGHDGSEDGPLSTPLLAEGHAFVVGAKGRLIALRLADGELAWTRTLQKDFGSEPPDYGFSTTPVLADGKLVVLTGGSDGRAISALDLETGKTLWSAVSGKVKDQMPVVLELAGQEQIVAVAGKRLMGLAPRNGEVLWTHEFGEDDWVGSSNPTYAGPSQFVLFASGEAVVFGVGQSDGRYAASELYRSKTLGNTYALPVYHDGYLYGFRGQILTCMNAGNGERVWRSRPPGGRGLILVGDKLVVFGANGTVVVADASPEGYRERARIEALGASAYTWPAFADGRILLRNLEEMAAVRLTDAGERSAESSQDARATGTALAAFLASLTEAEDKDAAITGFLEEHPHSPILDDGHAHFVFRGEAEDFAIRGSMLPNDNPVGMTVVDGTDLYYLSVEVEPGTRYEYHLVKDFGERMTDPRNPHEVPTSGKAMNSQFVTAGYEFSTHTKEPEGGSRGRIEEIVFESPSLGERELKVYLPPGYEGGSERYPLLLVHDGFDWLDKGLMANSLDNLIGQSVRPVVVAFLAPRRQWWLEAGGTGTDDHVLMVVDELMPHLAQTYRLSEAPGSHATMGHQGYGLTSAYLALTHPEIFGKSAIQSPQIGLGYGDALAKLLSSDAASRVTFYLDWNRREVRDLDAGHDLQAEVRRFVEMFEDHGIGYTGGEQRDSYGWVGWRGRTGRVLETLFPLR